jgi:hypothetical protein
MTSPAVDPQELTPAPSLSMEYKAKREFWLVVAVLTALYVVSVTLGNRRYVWFDELFTFDFARSTSMQQLWYRVLRFDCNPPAVYVLSRFSMSIFGATPLGLRFPSMVEFYFGSMVILLYVRRKVEIAFAAVAVLMLWVVAPTLYYAVEARAYALFFLSFACLLLSWDTAIHASRRGWALLGISVSTLALVGAHVFAPFTLLAFVVAEAVRFLRRKSSDFPLWAALLVPMLGILLDIPIIRLYKGIIFPQKASYMTIVVFFEDTFGAATMALVFAVVLLMPWRRKPGTSSPRFSAEEMALVACMFLSPILLNLILMHRHGQFYNRYCVPSQVTLLAALAIFLAHRVRLDRVVGYAVTALLILLLLKDQVWHPLRYPAPQRIGVLASVQPNLPIVIGEGQVFMEMNHRENQAFLDRVYFLKDPQASLQYAHTNYFQEFEAPDVMAKVGFPFTAKFAPYSDFVQQHRQFLLLANPAEWLFPKLLSSGASIAFAGDYGDAMPYSDRTLYLVTMPSSE